MEIIRIQNNISKFKMFRKLNIINYKLLKILNKNNFYYLILIEFVIFF